LTAKLLRSLGKPSELAKRIMAEFFLLIVRLGMLAYLFKRIYDHREIPEKVFSANWLVMIMYKTNKNF
jgi:hypothetical protein